jgi:O-antigen/teichoic acid export membrane protein
LLKIKAKTAVFWSLFSVLSGSIIQIGYGVIIARLLTPNDFGLMAMAMIMVTISMSLIDSGFYQAIIQKREINKDELSAVFKLNITIALIISLIILIFSDYFARLLEQQNLTEILNFLAFIVLIESLSLIQKATLIRELEFSLISKIDLTSLFISSVIGIILAFNDFGVYSLVFKTLLQSLFATILYWFFHPIKINLRSSFRNISSLFNFGYKVFIADQIEVLSNQIAHGSIGKNFNSNTLGFYTKGFQYQNLLSQTVIVGVNKVVFPAFSKIQDDNEKLRNSYTFLIKLSTFFILPLMLIVFITGKEIIYIFLGNQWGEAVNYFKIFCFSGIFYPFTIFNLNIIKVKGLGTMYLKVCLISKGLLLPAVLIGLNYGTSGIAIAVVFQQIFAAIINSSFSGKLIDYSFFQQVKDVFVYFIAATLSFFPSLLLYQYIDGINFFYSISIITFVFIIIYLITLFFFRKTDLNLIYKTLLKR